MSKSQLTVILCIMLISLPTVALATSPDAIRIPSEYAKVKEVCDNSFSSFEGAQTIIHIQDPHCNFEAQKNIALMLQYLIEEYGLKLILVEGGSGDVNLSFLRGYGDPKQRKEVAYKYLMNGEISGEEYLDIVSDYDIELYGIEDQGLYDAHLTSFLEIDPIMKEGLKDLEALSYIVKALKPHIYNESLIQLEKVKSDYEEKTVSLLEYCRSLLEIIRGSSLNAENYPQMRAFSETGELEKGIDFNRAEVERNELIKKLAWFLTEGEVKEIIDKSKEFKEGIITPEQYYSFLKDAAEYVIDVEDEYPELNAYIKYISISKEIKVPFLLEEIESLEKEVKETLFTDSDQRTLNDISKSLDILKGLLNLELTPQEYAYFKERRSQCMTTAWVDFLNTQCRKFGLRKSCVRSKAIDENLDRLERFYQLGAEREKAFIRNTLKKMNQSGEEIAVLIAGGFHTPGISRMLKDRGYSFVVTVPVITQKVDSQSYFSALRAKK